MIPVCGMAPCYWGAGPQPRTPPPDSLPPPGTVTGSQECPAVSGDTRAPAPRPPLHTQPRPRPRPAVLRLSPHQQEPPGAGAGAGRALRVVNAPQEPPSRSRSPQRLPPGCRTCGRCSPRAPRSPPRTPGRSRTSSSPGPASIGSTFPAQNKRTGTAGLWVPVTTPPAVHTGLAHAGPGLMGH